ncbi:MAG: lipopolysaccharide transport periplasmic protein LptA [Gammaproteobacteria bacterium]|jgi:lipopolysaccharide export system protein LptA
MSQAKSRCRGGLRPAALILLLLPVTAQALSTDREQQIMIEADSAAFDETEGISSYEGNVKLQQGTLKLQSERMTVHLADDRIVEIILTGSPASYRQRPDDKEVDVQAEAGEIRYNFIHERLILQGAAHIWQPGAEEFHSERIVIDLKNNSVSAGGSGPENRVRIILQPAKDSQEGIQPAIGQ